MKEMKSERFKRIATRRTTKILQALQLLGNCGNRVNYEYTDEQVKKVFGAIEKQLADTKARFKETGSQEFQL